MEVEDDPMAELARSMSTMEVSSMSDADAEAMYHNIRASASWLTIQNMQWSGATRVAKMWSIERTNECLREFKKTKDAEFLANAVAYLFEDIPCPESVRSAGSQEAPASMED